MCTRFLCGHVFEGVVILVYSEKQAADPPDKRLTFRKHSAASLFFPEPSHFCIPAQRTFRDGRKER